ncbi:MAG: ferrochelatase [Bacteroidetes bacterium]|nr:ferrochelatase [Bacteroidota bacterium]MBU1580251.1 ferrochelatase [Bacteroidota bacterium]MBU2465275.1 ferrochelatase [Bacteroidota bacterium]MBU2557994.1 ferrochelatase [Bacteroidota bacterium]
MQRAIILINVGTPDSPKTKDVRTYLREFLGDRRVIDIPAIPRWMLVNLIIAPFRAPKSAKLYEQLWTQHGSPLRYITANLAKKMQAKSRAETRILIAMRYGNPSIKKVLEQVRLQQPDEIIIVPMYPQYAESTTGTVSEDCLRVIKNWDVIPSLKIIGQFYNHPAFIGAFQQKIQAYKPELFDHVLFSYHGLPESHISRIHPHTTIEKCNCHLEFPAHGKYCYRATCFATTRLLQNACNIPETKSSIAFQSRLTKKWLRPFADEQIVELARKGVKELLVVAPAFVTDCLETSIEIGVEYNALFRQHGGQRLQLVASLNDEDYWAKALQEIINEKDQT